MLIRPTDPASHPANPSSSRINPAPDSSQLPGSDQILGLVAGLRWAALVCCLVALIIGAAVWAFSSHQGNPY